MIGMTGGRCQRALQSLDMPIRLCRRPRSRTARPNPRPPQGFLEEFSSCKSGSSGTTIASMDQHSDDPVSQYSEEVPEFTRVRCNTLWNGQLEGLISKPNEVLVTESDSISRNSSLDIGKSRNAVPHSNDRVNTHSAAGPSPATSDDSVLPAAGNADAWLVPGNIVWAKTFYNKWWPAEVMDESRVQECIGSAHVGQVLVQLFGSHQYAWLDPAGELSQFDHCYEEKSKNHSKAFQDALKQALSKRVPASSQILSNEHCDELKSTPPDEQFLEIWDTSSGTKDKCIGEGRSKRKRKLTIHFDELTVPENPMRKSRRLRIMRQLGLAPPAGSPFSLTHGRAA